MLMHSIPIEIDELANSDGVLLRHRFPIQPSVFQLQHIRTGDTLQFKLVAVGLSQG